ncbi:MAG: hypothetical protein ACLFRG_19545 [Desulfococcaceae bacterium]
MKKGYPGWFRLNPIPFILAKICRGELHSPSDNPAHSSFGNPKVNGIPAHPANPVLHPGNPDSKGKKIQSIPEIPHNPSSETLESGFSG